MAIAGGRDGNLWDPRAGAASATHLSDQGAQKRNKCVVFWFQLSSFNFVPSLSWQMILLIHKKKLATKVTR
jgi:hypothetical protein